MRPHDLTLEHGGDVSELLSWPGLSLAPLSLESGVVDPHVKGVAEGDPLELVG